LFLTQHKNNCTQSQGTTHILNESHSDSCRTWLNTSMLQKHWYVHVLQIT